MITDTEIKAAGVQALIKALGETDTKKFISLIQREPFDYTQWQRNLWPDQSLHQISAAAMKLRHQDG